MRLQILQVPDCSNVTPLRERLDEALGDTAAQVTVQVIDNDVDAAAAGMAGSPTLLVDGADPFAEPGRAPSVSCRRYRDTDGRVSGAPSVAQLRQALLGQDPQCCAAGPDTPEPSATTLQAWRARATPADPAERALHQAILRGFAGEGVAPDAMVLPQTAAPFGRPVAEVLARLHDRDVIRIGPDGAIRAAYPFSAVPTRHQVQLARGPSVDAMCVIDALGIPAMLDTDAVISTAAPDSGLTITITVTSGLAVWEPPTAVVFVGAQAGTGPSEELCCDHLNAFPDRAAGQAWVNAHPEVPGSIVDGADAEQLGARIFGGLLRG
ncbi:MAG: Alkylmercury lyase [Amycolatopsis sp.]|uniref:alkylmercury lyase family protein n=1 Tax=Amycolatopsis sp. TaxID=37632 RepID=UPI00260C267E|nr:alkylmercury lyase family protein [Amycolatopsis sp.]MCU1680505.1 Alkylmercury lyase [Amycolatopsis sp.]